MLAAYVSGHGFGHLTRLCEVLRAILAREPALRIAIVGAVPGPLVRGAIPAVEHRAVACDVGLVQKDALEIDEAATAERCRAFDERWDERVEAERAWLSESGARAVLADIPALAFAAAARAGIPAIGLANFSWDWIYRHLAARRPSLASSADRAATAYSRASLLLALPFAGDLSAFPVREDVGLVARWPHVTRAEARRRLALDGRPAALVSFGGIGLPGLRPASLRADPVIQYLFPGDVGEERLCALGLEYVDVVGAVDVVVTKPGYGIVSDAIGAGTRLVYTDRGDFPEYPIMVREMTRWLASAYVPSAELRAGRIAEAIRRALSTPMPPRPDLGGAERAAARVAEVLRGV